MKAFKDRLQEAMNVRQIRATDLSRSTGISKASISQYTHGKYEPSGDTLCRLAQVLNVSEAWLMGQDVPMDIERDHLPKGLEPAHLRSFPVLGDIACGSPLLAVENRGDFISAPADVDADFILVAKGDSMIGARIFDGDEVLIKQAEIVNNGEIAAVILDDEATLKRFYFYPDKHRMVLQPENAKYEPMIYEGKELENVRIVGRAVSVLSKLT